MTTYKIFSTKAEKYARYRWDYSPRALEAMFSIASISSSSAVADFGAGTGILPLPLAERAGKVFAIEPNPEMSLLAEKLLRKVPTCAVVRACAEAVPLPDHSVDIVTAITLQTLHNEKNIKRFVQ